MSIRFYQMIHHIDWRPILIWYRYFMWLVDNGSHNKNKLGLVLWFNYINPGSQIPQVEARKRSSRDLFTSSRRARALIDRHFWYTFLQQSKTRLINTAILLTYTSRFHWRFSGNWQEQICECNIRCFGLPRHLSLGSDRLNVTVCRTCTVPLWDVQRTVGSWNYWKKYPWMAGVTFIKFPISLFHRRTWYKFLRRGGPNDRMTVENIGKWRRVCPRESAHSISLMDALLHSTRTQRCLITITLRCQRVPGPWHG